MYGVSAGFLAALAAPSMVAVTRVRTTAGVELAISEGSVSMDSRRGITRACDLTLIPTADLSADDLYRLAMNPQTEIIVERGLMVSGVAEYIPLGIFSTDTAEIDKSVGGSVKFTGSDRAKNVSRARFVDPYTIASGTALATAGADLLVSRYALADYDFSNVTDTIGAQLVFEAGESSDPWAQAQALFADHGYDLHFNGDGVAVAVPIPGPATTAVVFSFGAGDTNLVLGGDKRGSLEGTYNGVIASGEGSAVATPVRAEVWDDDPSSPTYYGSGFGRAPYFYSSPLLTTAAMCETAARTMLARVKGRTEQLSWPAVVNPALEPLDVVTVTIGASASTCVIDSLTIPLKAADPMSAVARETAVY